MARLGAQHRQGRAREALAAGPYQRGGGTDQFDRGGHGQAAAGADLGGVDHQRGIERVGQHQPAAWSQPFAHAVQQRAGVALHAAAVDDCHVHRGVRHGFGGVRIVDGGGTRLRIRGIEQPVRRVPSHGHGDVLPLHASGEDAAHHFVAGDQVGRHRQRSACWASAPRGVTYRWRDGYRTSVHSTRAKRVRARPARATGAAGKATDGRLGMDDGGGTRLVTQSANRSANRPAITLASAAGHRLMLSDEGGPADGGREWQAARPRSGGLTGLPGLQDGGRADRGRRGHGRPRPV